MPCVKQQDVKYYTRYDQKPFDLYAASYVHIEWSYWWLSLKKAICTLRTTNNFSKRNIWKWGSWWPGCVLYRSSRFMLILHQPLSLLIKSQTARCSVWVSGEGVVARFYLLLPSAEHVAMLTRADSEIARTRHHCCTRQRHTCTFITRTRESNV